MKYRFCYRAQSLPPPPTSWTDGEEEKRAWAGRFFPPENDFSENDSLPDEKEIKNQLDNEIKDNPHETNRARILKQIVNKYSELRKLLKELHERSGRHWRSGVRRIMFFPTPTGRQSFASAAVSPLSEHKAHDETLSLPFFFNNPNARDIPGTQDRPPRAAHAGANAQRRKSARQTLPLSLPTPEALSLAAADTTKLVLCRGASVPRTGNREDHHRGKRNEIVQNCNENLRADAEDGAAAATAAAAASQTEQAQMKKIGTRGKLQSTAASSFNSFVQSSFAVVFTSSS